jgi:hypothetical protein
MGLEGINKAVLPCLLLQSVTWIFPCRLSQEYPSTQQSSTSEHTATPLLTSPTRSTFHLLANGMIRSGKLGQRLRLENETFDLAHSWTGLDSCYTVQVLWRLNSSNTVPTNLRRKSTPRQVQVFCPRRKSKRISLGIFRKHNFYTESIRVHFCFLGIPMQV